jgi:predicted HicB family RNase H-like nuclease
MRYRPRESESKSKKIVVNITPTQHQFLKIVAVHQEITLSELMLRAVRQYLNETLKEDHNL